MIELYLRQSTFILLLEEKWKTKKDRFLSFLLDADFESAVNFADRFIKSSEDIENLYLKIIMM